MSIDGVETEPVRLPPGRGALSHVLRSRPLRGAFVGSVVAGVGVSIAIPQLTLFLVDDLHLSASTAGLYSLTNLAAPVAGWFVGSWSDRVRSRLPVLLACAAAGALGWLLIAVATAGWMPFVLNLVLLSVGGAQAAQLQAMVRDELTAHPTPLDHRVVAIVRTAFSAGWVVGPVLGAVLGAALGLRPLLAATGLLLLASALPMIGASPPRTGSITTIGRAAPGERRALRAVLVFTAISVLATCGETVKLAYLPLYMADGLHLPAAVRGGLIGLQPLIEVVLMPIAAVVAGRVRMTAVLVAAALLATAAQVAYASAALAAAPLLPLLAGQVLMSGSIAVTAVCGVVVAQRLLPHRVGLASTVFLSSYAVNGAVGGLVGAVGVAVLGLPALFVVPAALSLVGAGALAVFGRRHRMDAAEPLPDRVRAGSVRARRRHRPRSRTAHR